MCKYEKTSNNRQNWTKLGFSHGLKNMPPACFYQHFVLAALSNPDSDEKCGNRESDSHIFGRSIGIRTRGLLDPNQARYQASPYPDSQSIIADFGMFVKPKCEVWSVECVKCGVWSEGIAFGDD